jgi:hypothetical protein
MTALPGRAERGTVSITTTPAAVGRSPNGRLDAPPRASERLPQPARRRRPALAALAVMLVVGCSAVSASLVLASGDTVSVVTVARAVPAGRAVVAEDLGTADIAGSGLTAVAAADRDSIVGLTAAVDLLPGTLLSDAMVTREPVPGPGQAVVGLSLKPGLLPEAELKAGRAVMLVRLPVPAGTPDTTTAESPGSEILVPRARVLSETTDPTTGGRLVSLLVEQAAAAEISRAAAAGTVSLVVIGPGA